jgi:hypothetical protein
VVAKLGRTVYDQGSNFGKILYGSEHTRDLSARLQQPSGSLMLGLDYLIGVAKGDILGNISLHSIPPIGYLEIVVHHIPSWINGISGLVGFLKYLVLQLIDIRHTNTSFVPQHTLVVFHKFG